MRPIETRFGGYRFRSRLEARWAVFFSQLNVPWEYEPEGFELGNRKRYLPDFLIRGRAPHRDLWVEIKPRVPVSAEEGGRFLVFSEEIKKIGGHAMLIAGDPVDPIALWPTSDEPLQAIYQKELFGIFSALFGLSEFALSNAAVAARSARFEHSEVGIPDTHRALGVR